MKIVTLLAYSVLLVQTLRADSSAWIQLFDGRDIEGWETFLAKPIKEVSYVGEKRDSASEHIAPIGINVDPTGVFSVVSQGAERLLRISGEVFGTLTTRKEFSNYHLRIEMRWGLKKWPPRLQRPRDAGILYHAFGNYPASRPWLSSYELQIQEKDFGDFYAVDTRALIAASPISPVLKGYDPLGVPTQFGPSPDPRRCVRLADFEASLGEWNVVEIVCQGDRSWHVVNGRVVMRLEKLKSLENGQWKVRTGGRIQLQSEGAEWFIRKIEIRSLAAGEQPDNLWPIKPAK
jgi:hypothetical protein